jgi:hypothetical protein
MPPIIERPQPLDENVVEEAAAPVHRDADAGPFERPGEGLARELARNGMAAIAQIALPDATPVGPLSAQLRRTDGDLLCPLHVDTVEKLEFQPRSRFRRPLAASIEISLETRRSDRACHVRSSCRPHRGNYWRRRHRARRSKIFVRARFPSFSTISVDSRR